MRLIEMPNHHQAPFGGGQDKLTQRCDDLFQINLMPL